MTMTPSKGTCIRLMAPKVKTERLTIPEEELLREVAVLAPVKRNVTFCKMPKKGVPRGGKIELISLRSSATAKRRSVLEESKYGPNSGPQWKAEGSRYPNLYKVLLQEPLRLRKRELLENNSQVKKPGGQNTRRLVCAWIRKQ